MQPNDEKWFVSHNAFNFQYPFIVNALNSIVNFDYRGRILYSVNSMSKFSSRLCNAVDPFPCLYSLTLQRAQNSLKRN